MYKENARILFVSSYTRHRPLANAACLVAGAIVTSLVFHPPAKVSTPIAGEFPSVQLNIDSNIQPLCRMCNTIKSNHQSV